MSGDYTEILHGSWDNVPEPKALPVGSYLLRGSNASFQAPRDADKKPVVLFVVQPKEAMDDVQQTELDALGEYDISDNRIFHRVYIETKADWDKVRKVLEKFGVETKGKGIEESLKAFRGHEAIGYLDQQNYEDKNSGEMRTNNVIKELAPVNS